ncbi:MAG: hypothetical protein J6Y62_09165, partial [Clostridia bacterium]|nr:hypothetical protein [Clostridia bacterium]
MERKRAKSTVTLERQMLKYLLKDKFVLQGRLSSCREEWFTSEERAAIFEIVRRNYETSKNCVSETRFKFLLDTVFASEDDETLKKRVQTEFEVVQGTGLDGDVGSVVASLNEALMGTRLEDLLLESFDAVQHGDVEGALAKLKQGTMMLNSGTQDDDEATPLWGDKDDAWKRREMDVRAHPELYAGIKTGFKKYDDLTGGLFPAELYLIFGLSGKGKSSVMKQIAINVSHQGKNVLLCANEENKHQIKTKLVSNETQTTYRDWKLGRFTDDDRRKYEEMSEARA